MKRLYIQRQAADDAEQTAFWYQQQASLGTPFLLELDAALERVAADPGHYQVQFHGVPRALLRGFPYAVYFLLVDEVVEVLAIMHQHRDSAAWRARAPSP